MKIGFSGTRKGLTNRQAEVVDRALKFFWDLFNDNEFHHGDCIGADEQAGKNAFMVGYKIHVHPPTDPKERAFVKNGTVYLHPDDYLNRNRNIVDASDLMIICPGEEQEQVRGSGTWQAYRHTKEMRHNFILIYPTGKTVVNIRYLRHNSL